MLGQDESQRQRGGEGGVLRAVGAAQEHPGGTGSLFDGCHGIRQPFPISPAPRASSWAVCTAERASTKARALGRVPEVMRTLALFWSRSTTVAAFAESIGR